MIAVRVLGARTHNLKGVDCHVPHGQVTVVTGPSGAGKSSLAFDTIYAEGQRRFIESMSTYTRQFLDKMERPPVDEIENVLPTVALEAHNSVKNARSTVGTITEVHDLLRLLFTHIGVVHCPEGHGEMEQHTAASLASKLASGALGERVTLVARVSRPQRGANEALQELIRQGFGRVLASDDDERVERLEPGARWLKRRDPLPLVLGRFRADEGSLGRILAAVEQGLSIQGLADGVLDVHGDVGRTRLRPGLACPVCARPGLAPTPPLFSFNSPLGACQECQGFGRVIGIDRDRVVPDPSRTLEERPIAPWNSPAYEDLYEGLFESCLERGVPLDLPWSELDPADREWIWSGASVGRRRSGFTSIDRFFQWMERRSYRVHVRVLLARYRAYHPCASCEGTRLQPRSRAVRVAQRALPELTTLALRDLREWFEQTQFSQSASKRAGHLLEQLRERLEVLDRVGLGYLTLDRQARTLSGGETQRIHLAAALGSGLTSTLYVLDEPTVGLHARDSEALLALLHDLAARGNTVLVVEHDPVLIEGADWLIDLGPAAGEGGGRLMAEGPPGEVLSNPESLTARYLGPGVVRSLESPGSTVDAGESGTGGTVEIVGASQNNLQDVSVSFPFPALVAVCGVSGSGKSTLVNDVLYANFQRSRGEVEVDPGAVRQIDGLEEIEDVVLVDQRPIGRSTRSNPATYVKAYDEIRKLFAAQPDAKRAGIGPGHFSFNTDKGRCPECEGTGVVQVDMHFMAPVRVTCDSCQGHRFKQEILKVRLRGRDIAETLELTVDEAAREFSENRSLVRRLEPLRAVGLGYLRLGQPTATLSGGEAQRLKLAAFLGGPKQPDRRSRLFLFDEPTTGLHLADIEQLYRTLRHLVEQGEGVVVVEHNLELIAASDWVIDLGPGGGDSGGRLLYSGPTRSHVDAVDSPTARVLRSRLGSCKNG